TTTLRLLIPQPFVLTRELRGLAGWVESPHLCLHGAIVRGRNVAPPDRSRSAVGRYGVRGMKHPRVRLEARRNDRADILAEWMQAVTNPQRRLGRCREMHLRK